MPIMKCIVHASIACSMTGGLMSALGVGWDVEFR